MTTAALLLEQYDSILRRKLFIVVEKTHGYRERCQICNTVIRRTHMAGNALAQTSHLRTHADIIAPESKFRTDRYEALADIPYPEPTLGGAPDTDPAVTPW